MEKTIRPPDLETAIKRTELPTNRPVPPQSPRKKVWTDPLAGDELEIVPTISAALLAVATVGLIVCKLLEVI